MESTKKKAAPAPPHFGILKDTLHLIPKKNVESESSSPSSSIPEMTRLEETQLRRSFNAIQRPATPPSPKEHDFGASFNFAFQKTQDDYDDVLTPKTKSRGITDDSDDDDDERFKPARGSGMFKSPLTDSKESVISLGSAGSNFVQVSSRDRNIPSSDDETVVKSLCIPSSDDETVVKSLWSASDDMARKLDDLTRPGSSANWDANDATPNSSIHIVPQATRERTPDATAMRGQLIMGSFGNDRPGVNRGNLDQTMRDRFRDVSHEETSPKAAMGSPTTPTSPLGVTMRDRIKQKSQETPFIFPPGMSHDDFSIGSPNMSQPNTSRPPQGNETKDDDENIKPLWPKCLLLAVGLSILLAGIVASVVLLKEHRKKEANFGMVLDDDITHQECIHVVINNDSLVLGGSFFINCTIDLDHDQRTDLTGTNTVTLTYPNLNTTDVDVTTFTGVWISGPIQATCATIGRYNVTFKGGKKSEPFSLLTSLTPPTVTTTMEQFFRNDTDGSSYFTVECSVFDDCTNYEVDVVGRIGNNEENFRENKTCMTSYSNTEGTNTKCTATLSDTTMNKYDQKDQLNCKLSQNEEVIKVEPFRYPECGIKQACSETVNCTAKSTERERIENCQFDAEFMDRCFQDGRKIQSYCQENACTCKMNWCIRSRFIYSNVIKDEVPAESLCNIEPVTFTAYTTTTTSTTTTNDVNDL